MAKKRTHVKKRPHVKTSSKKTVSRGARLLHKRRPKDKAVRKASVREVRTKRVVRKVRRRQKALQQRVFSISTEEKGTLKSALSIVRQHVKGYELRDGWAVKNFDRITPQRRATLLKKAASLKVLLRQPHDLVKAPINRATGKSNVKARHELYRFTSQKIRGAKHFIVHKPDHNFSVSFVRGRVRVRGKFSGKVRGKRRSKVITESAFYLFPRTAHDLSDAEDMLDDLLEDMPEGYYVMLTGMHGDTGEPVDRDSLRARLRDYVNRYQTDSVAIYDRMGNFVQRRETDTGFLQAITGFRFLSTSVDGRDLQMAARDARRASGARENERVRKERMSTRERHEYDKPEKARARKLARRQRALKGWKTRKARAKK